MGTLINDVFDPVSLGYLTSHSNPEMIHQTEIAQAAKELIKAIKSLDLYPNLQLLVNHLNEFQESYSIFSHRTLYVWKISQACYQLTSLNLSRADFLVSNSLKCQCAFLNILFDDICDLSQERALFDKCVAALNGDVTPGKDEALCSLIAETWAGFQNTIEQTANFQILRPMFDDAYRKWIYSFEYAFSMQGKTPPIQIDWKEHLEIIAHSGTLYLTGLIDLLFVPELSIAQATLAAQVFVRTQKMGQIANWLTTWPRELAQHDFTSGVFIIALENHSLTSNDLENGLPENIIRKIQDSGVEKMLWKEWEHLRVESAEIAKEIHSSVMDGYVESFSAIMFMLIASTKLI